MVISLARCMRAISAGDLIMRQPAVTGVAADALQRGDFLAKAVEGGEADLLLDADALPVAMPLSAQCSARPSPDRRESIEARTSFGRQNPRPVPGSRLPVK